MNNCRLLSQAKAFFLSLTCPQSIRTNRSSGLLRLIACICMAIDHFGKMCFPNQPWMRLVGRLAFPLFAYGIAVGAVCTRDPIAYLKRIILLALICQPLYALGLDHETTAMYAVPFLKNPLLSTFTFYMKSWQKPSILLSLAAGLSLLICLRKKQWVMAFFVYVLCERFSGSLDYGIDGIRLMLIFYCLCEHPLLCFAASVSYILHWSLGYGYVFFGTEFSMRIFAVPAIILACLPVNIAFRLPKWFSYAFYPAHLVVLALIAKLGS